MRSIRTRSVAFASAMLLALCPVFATGCKGEEKGRVTGDTGESPEDAIKRLEDEGKLPVLDRSDDLVGPDENKNGIRDDIDTFIEAQAYTSTQTEAVHQYARQMQRAVTFEGSSTQDAERISDAGDRAQGCIFERFTEWEMASDIAENVEKLTANSAPRIRNYLRYNALLDGTVYTLEKKGTACD